MEYKMFIENTYNKSHQKHCYKNDIVKNMKLIKTETSTT